MGDAYPELRAQQARVTDVLQQEEEQLLPDHRQRHGDPRGGARRARRQARRCRRDVAFKLHDTYGFPVDLTADVCRERGVARRRRRASTRLLDEQRERGARRRQVQDGAGPRVRAAAPRPSTATRRWSHDGARVVAIYVDGSRGRRPRSAGDDAVVVLDHTPFYAESGGQVGDTGELRNATARMLVEDTVKIQAAVFGHQGRVVEGAIAVGDVVATPGSTPSGAPAPCATTARRT